MTRVGEIVYKAANLFSGGTFETGIRYGLNLVNLIVLISIC